MTRLRELVLSIALLVPAMAGAADESRPPVTDFRELMVQALDSPAGTAAGVLSGPMADAIGAHFKASSPIRVEVSTLRRYRQPGCARLNVRFSQDGVVLPGAAQARTETLDIGINYCRDGQPPRSLS